MQWHTDFFRLAVQWSVRELIMLFTSIHNVKEAIPKIWAEPHFFDQLRLLSNTVAVEAMAWTMATHVLLFLIILLQIVLVWVPMYQVLWKCGSKHMSSSSKFPVLKQEILQANCHLSSFEEFSCYEKLIVFLLFLVNWHQSSEANKHSVLWWWCIHGCGMKPWLLRMVDVISRYPSRSRLQQTHFLCQNSPSSVIGSVHTRKHWR
jgi:hypothetical protein